MTDATQIADIDTVSTPPGGLTKSSPGQTDRVAEIVAKTTATAKAKPLFASTRVERSAEYLASEEGQAAIAKVYADSDRRELVSNRAKNTRMINNPPSEPMDVSAARALTDEIKRDVEATWTKIVTAYLGRAWVPLGYESWDAYTDAEFESVRLRLPREERQDVVCSLRESGLSIRAIASGVGISDQTVQRDLASGVVNHYTSPDETEAETEVVEAEIVEPPESETVIGLDGKTHPKSKPAPRPRPSRLRGFTYDLTPVRKALRQVPEQVARFDQLADDDQFRDWFGEVESRVADVRRAIAKAIEQLQRMDERVQQVASGLRNINHRSNCETDSALNTNGHTGSDGGVV
ncbi:MAG: hypothetical protein ACLP9Y_06250 [Mycobacterium sp.]